jgi:hypothetical protein
MIRIYSSWQNEVKSPFAGSVHGQSFDHIPISSIMPSVTDWYFNSGEFPENMNNLPEPDYELRMFPFTEERK